MPLMLLGLFLGGGGALFASGTAKKTMDTMKYVSIAVILFFAYKFAKDFKWI